MNGLSFKKTDLHVHTPASSCYKDDNYTPEKFVDDAISKGIEVIAITDHNSGSGIDEIKKAAINKNLTVFPGIEITAKEGFHIVAIFDVDKGTKEINNFLSSKLGFEESQLGKPNERNLDACSILKQIKQNGGIGIIAHIDSDKVSPCNKIDAIELKKFLENKDYDAIETYDGKLPDFYNKKQIRKIPTVYKASDNPHPSIPKKHSSEGMGVRYSYFKLDNNINLKSLKQCFIDPDVRIINDEKIERKNYTYIEKIEVEGGFLDKQSIEFHNGLNCIIGGKGTGKSLIVEFLRFALENISNIDEVAKDNKEKIINCLGKNGKIKIIIKSSDSQRYLIETSIGNLGPKFELVNPLYKCIKLSTGEQFMGKIGDFFPMLVYSQNEILFIAKNNDALLKLLDSFVDLTEENVKLKTLSQELEQLNYSFVDSYSAKNELEQIKQSINTQKEKIKQTQSAITKIASPNLQKIINTITDIKNQKEAIEDAIIFVDSIIGDVEHLEQDYIKFSDSEYTQDAFTQKEVAALEAYYLKEFKTFKNGLSQKYKETKSNLTKKNKQLDMTFKKLQKEYDKEETITKKLNDLSTQKDQMNKILKSLNEKAKNLKDKANNFTKYKKARKSKTEEYYSYQEQKFNKRKALYDEITSLSNAKLKLELKKAADKTKYNKGFDDLLFGSRIKNLDGIIESLLEKFTINEITEFIFDKKTDSLNKVIENKDKSEKIIDWIWQNGKITEFLNLIHKLYPEDVPVVQYNKNKNGKANYAELKDLSVGQKSNALLIIALLKGDFPVVIDQPEDALDITSVWEDVSLNLRKNKIQRQFILTTHNNCVAVASDTDNFISLSSNNDHGFVNNKGGGIESSTDAIMDHLEGGLKPYELRNKKYLLN